MARTFNPIVGTASPPAYSVNDPFGYQTAEKLRNDLNMLALGCFERNVFMGGSREFAIDGSATGDVDLPLWLPIEVDNSNSQISGSGNIVVQVRFYVRVSNSAIGVTPKVYDLTAAATATISGASTCTSTTADMLTGTAQAQVITLTLPAAKHQFKPQLTISGTPAAGYHVWGIALYDCYINN